MATSFSTAIVKESDAITAGRKVAEEASKKLQGKKPDIALLFTSSALDYSLIMKGMSEVLGKIPIIGCTSAGEFTEEMSTKGGVACALISSDTHRFFTGLGKKLKEDVVQSVQNAASTFPMLVKEHPYLSAMLFLDGLAGNGEEAVMAASSVFGPMVKFAGGAAADDLKFKDTRIFEKGHSYSDALSLCLIASRVPVFISVKHGHKPISPPLKITKAKGNILYEIDGKPAWDVWKHYLREKFKKENGVDIDKIKEPSEISKILMRHEAGLLTGVEYKIRFPASVNPDGSLNFVCSIIEGSVIKIMDSGEEDQVDSARVAAEMAVKASKGIKIAGAVVFDCACREMILGEHFSKAVIAISKVLHNVPVIGFETYGEIAMELGQMSGFHNTTTVIMLIPE